MMTKDFQHIYFIAICGTAMGSLAAMLKSQGHRITGSDTNVYPPMSTFLIEQGVEIFQGFDERHLDHKPDLVIVGNAVSRGNPEVEAVLERKIPFMSLAVALKEFFIKGHYSIVVAGTHGKTTTSSLLAWLFENAGLSPGFLIGGIPQNFNQGFKIGGGDIFIVEGDEYDTAFFDKGAKFFHYLPDLVILNSVEFDHADIYEDFEHYKLAFKRLINIIPRNGLLLACQDDNTIKELISTTFCPVQTFGIDSPAFWSGRNITYAENNTTFDVYRDNQVWGQVSVSLSGKHNVRNALAAIATAHYKGVSKPLIQQGLTTFKSVKKRLEVKAKINDIIIYDDFAHHPTEVRTTIEGLRLQHPERRIWAVFEPRSATAKRKIMEEGYSTAFRDADCVIIAPLHRPDKVKENDRLSPESLISQIKEHNCDVNFIDSIEKIVTFLADNIKPGDIILFMSNGSFGGIHDLIINRFS
jgi:UDP-N-acetylmuramate: L-alanyl-gamma-D-glutamyl-meso-diaminopimelate ligase